MFKIHRKKSQKTKFWENLYLQGTFDGVHSVWSKGRVKSWTSLKKFQKLVATKRYLITFLQPKFKIFIPLAELSYYFIISLLF